MSRENVLVANWTHDCQGKQDYDADLVRLSARYWPAGGGMLVYDTRTGDWLKPNVEIKPSATATIMLQDADLYEASFNGDTEAEVKAQVEAWANEQFDKIAAAMRALAALKESET